MSFKEKVINVKDGIVSFCSNNPEIVIWTGIGLAYGMMFRNGYKIGRIVGYMDGFMDGESRMLKVSESLKK